MAGEPLRGPAAGTGPALAWPFPRPQCLPSSLNPAVPLCTAHPLHTTSGLCLAFLWAEAFCGAAGPDGAMFLAQVAYPDCSPIMLLSEASLVDLNTRLEKKLKMDRFRPSIVVTGCDAYEEVRGSSLLCIKLKCAGQDANRTAVPFAQRRLRPSTGSLLPLDGPQLTLWSSALIAAPITLLASGGRCSPFLAWAPKQAIRSPNCIKCGMKLD